MRKGLPGRFLLNGGRTQMTGGAKDKPLNKVVVSD
jgi:hypothetical protein